MNQQQQDYMPYCSGRRSLLSRQLPEDIVDVEAAATASEQQGSQESENPEASNCDTAGGNTPAPAVLYMGRPLNFAPTHFTTSWSRTIPTPRHGRAAPFTLRT